MLNGIPKRHIKLQIAPDLGSVGSFVDMARGLSAESPSLCAQDLPLQSQP